jgi:uncharacterized membrane protein YjdF
MATSPMIAATIKTSACPLSYFLAFIWMLLFVVGLEFDLEFNSEIHLKFEAKKIGSP